MSYIYEKSNALPAPIFTKPANAQQHYVCVCVCVCVCVYIYIYIYSTKFCENWKINVESTNRNTFVSLKKVWLTLCQLSQSWPLLNKFLWTSPMPHVFQNRQKYIERKCKLSFTPISEVWITVYQISMLSGINWRSPAPNFIQISGKWW